MIMISKIRLAAATPGTRHGRLTTKGIDMTVNGTRRRAVLGIGVSLLGLALAATGCASSGNTSSANAAAASGSSSAQVAAAAKIAAAYEKLPATINITTPLLKPPT